MVENKPPLKLLLEPDEYLCTWFVPGPEGAAREYAGSLDLRSDREPVGSIYGDVPISFTVTADGLTRADFPQNVELPQLRARLANGYDVDLVDVSIYSGFPTKGYIRAASATGGVPSPDTRGSDENISSDPRGGGPSDGPSSVPTYWRLSMQIGALDAVAGAAPLSRWSAPTVGHGRHLEGEWTVSGNPDSSQKWSDDNVTVFVDYDASIRSGDPYAFRFAASPVMRICRERDSRWLSGCTAG